jgi:arsenite/tail-anchored protein-transporting ATPase
MIQDHQYLPCPQNLLDKFGAGQLMEKLSELKLDELLSTPPPGLDEAIAISKVVEFVEKEEYARFTRIVFDTAPTGHTLRMLSLPDFVAAALQKVQTLQSKLGTGGPLIQGIFGNPQGLQSSAEQLKKLEKRVLLVSQLFRCESFMCFSVAAGHVILLGSCETEPLI